MNLNVVKVADGERKAVEDVSPKILMFPFRVEIVADVERKSFETIVEEVDLKSLLVRGPLIVEMVADVDLKSFEVITPPVIVEDVERKSFIVT